MKFLAILGLSTTLAAQVLTFHNDNQRTGATLHETKLNTLNVNGTHFGKLGLLSADGKVDAEPLYVPALKVNGATHNVVFVASEHDSIYAYDADTLTVLWHTTALQGQEQPSGDQGCLSLTPEIGITSTPVIDLSSPQGVMYFVAMSMDTQAYHQRLHKIDITTGRELPGSPVDIQARYPGTGENSQDGYVIFDPKQYLLRAALLKVGGSLYLGWGSHCDIEPYTGWVMQYDSQTLKQQSVLNVTPNGGLGGFWAAGGGMAADSDGYVYMLDGNGSFDTVMTANGLPAQGDYGNAFLKLGGQDGKLKVADYFAPYNTVQESDKDQDMGSGGTLVVDTAAETVGEVRHLVVGAGKDTKIYVADRGNMGKWNPSSNANIYQEVSAGSLYGCWCSPAYWNDTVYYGGVADRVKAWRFGMGKLSSQPVSQTSAAFTYPGVTPSVSANGLTQGILWILETPVTKTDPGVLHAFDATDLTHELYNSNQNPTRDQFGQANKFATPMIANGRVYTGVTNGVVVFGLLQ